MEQLKLIGWFEWSGIMTVIGIIAEYNPLHNGHLYHIETARELADADGVICVMGGNFLQRGEPALVNKWVRAKMALSAGVDLVFELPTAYATRSANWFAHGAISLLTATGVVTHVVFGSELGQLAPLEEIARVLAAEPASFREQMLTGLEQGLAFPLARGLALQHYFDRYRPASGRSPAQLAETILQPNNILAIEYLKEIIRQKAPHPPDDCPSGRELSSVNAGEYRRSGQRYRRPALNYLQLGRPAS
jgi:predicted nucleotidyltransferase